MGEVKHHGVLTAATRDYHLMVVVSLLLRGEDPLRPLWLLLLWGQQLLLVVIHCSFPTDA